VSTSSQKPEPASGREAAYDAAVAKLNSIYSGQIPERVAREITDAALDAVLPATSFVVMIGDTPLAVASSLETAQAEAVRRKTEYGTTHTLRWDEHRPGEQWRLMSRYGDRGRFSWTQYWVAAVPVVGTGTEAGAR